MLDGSMLERRDAHEELAPRPDDGRGAAPGKETRAAAAGHEENTGGQQQERGAETTDGASLRMDPWPPAAVLAAMGLDVEGEGGDAPEASPMRDGGDAGSNGAERDGGAPVQRKASGAGAAGGAPPPGGGGEPLAPEVRGPMERSFGADFSAVRVHQGEHVNALGAQAYAQGAELHFAPGRYDPGSSAGRELIGHELAHVVQQADGKARAAPQGKGGAIHEDPGLEREADEQGARAARGEALASGPLRQLASPLARPIQRRIQPEDVASELVGREFTLSADDGGLRRGAVVRPTAWSNTSRTVPVRDAGGRDATVQKSHLRPRNAAVAGMNPYTANVGRHAAAAEAADQTAAAWRAREGEYRSVRGRDLWVREMARLDEIAATRNRVLNRRLIQDTQLNRFDAIIQAEVNAANAAAGYTGAAALDPNLVKSMIFQESQMGTAGEHLGDPSSAVKTRFNLGQTIDSSGSQLLLLMEREHTALLARFHLTNLRRDLETAMRRKEELEGMRARTAAQDAELRVLQGQARQNWEYFIWGYQAPGQALGFQHAVTELFRSPGGGRPPRNEDYQFWIHLMVMWLFEKRQGVRSWSEAIRAYNGSGTRAVHYRDAVVARRDAAAAGSHEPDGL